MSLAPTAPRMPLPRPGGWVRMLGPSFVAAVAYVDPGNFVTNIQGGARFGSSLLWVVLAAGIMAMPVQYLSAKLGAVTGKDLAAHCGERYHPAVRWMLWAQAELVVMATDLAEFVGAAIGLSLLCGLPLPVSGGVTAVVAFALPALRARGARAFETVVIVLLAVVAAGFLYETYRAGLAPGDTAHGLVPAFAGPGAPALAAAIVGATIMPHAIYLHSALTPERWSRPPGGLRAVLRAQRNDVLIALGLACVVNATMLIVAARLFHTPSRAGVTTLADAHAAFAALLGGGAALVFAVALLAAGLSSSGVGTYAGEVVMAGLLHARVSPVLRRLVTMLPALVLLLCGTDPTWALLVSQLVLSFGIPFAVIPLVLLTSDRSVMGDHVNRRGTTLVGTAIAAVVIALNAYLLMP